jgi:hypothetical protein
MSTEDRSFDELLKDAPKANVSDTVSIAGTLAKSDDPGKFVLTMADGKSVTLDTSAVKKHMVLGHSVGHTVVLVEVDGASAKEAGLSTEGTMGALGSTFFTDPHTAPFHYLDKPPFLDPNTPPSNTENAFNPVHGQADQAAQIAGVTPFSLALQHHVAQAQLEALYYSGLGGMRTYFSLNWTTDHHTIFKVIADPMR